MNLFNFDQAYKEILVHILQHGRKQVIDMQSGPTEVLSVFNSAYTFPGHVVPLLSLRKVHLNTLIKELKWIISGELNTDHLGKSAHIWEPWADSEGYLESNYGRYLRSFPAICNFRLPGEASMSSSGTPPHTSPAGWYGVDQVQLLIDSLAMLEYPSRRLQLTLNHPDNFFASILPPCMSGLGLNWYVDDRFPLERQVIVNIKFRSSDFGMGFIFDILQWYLFTQLLLQTVNQINPKANYRLSAYTFSADNQHIYLEHLPQLMEIAGRPNFNPCHWLGDLEQPLTPDYNYLGITKSSTLQDFHVLIGNYAHGPHVPLKLIS